MGRIIIESSNISKQEIEDRLKGLEYCIRDADGFLIIEKNDDIWQEIFSKFSDFESSLELANRKYKSAMYLIENIIRDARIKQMEEEL